MLKNRKWIDRLQLQCFRIGLYNTGRQDHEICGSLYNRPGTISGQNNDADLNHFVSQGLNALCVLQALGDFQKTLFDVFAKY